MLAHRAADVSVLDILPHELQRVLRRGLRCSTGSAASSESVTRWCTSTLVGGTQSGCMGPTPYVASTIPLPGP